MRRACSRRCETFSGEAINAAHPEHAWSFVIGRLQLLLVCSLLIAPDCRAAIDSLDPVLLLQQAVSLLPLRGKEREINRDLSESIRLFERQAPESLDYAQALDLHVLLARGQALYSGRDLKQDAQRALGICESHGEDDERLALALETAAAVAGDHRDELLARAFPIRARNVSALKPEIAQQIDGPICTGNTGNCRKPTIARKIEPSYPALALHARLECKGVLVGTVIDTAGVPGRFELKRSCGYGFDERAVATFRQWRFHPATDKDGKPVPFAGTTEIAFRLIGR